MNPEIPTAHRKGWGSYTDATTKPVSFVFQWWGEWKDNSGNLVLYILQYRDFITKKSDESAWFATPTATLVEVNAIFIPAKKAEQLAKEAAKQVETYKNK